VTTRFVHGQHGFTLAELAIALVILALLLAGAIIPLSTQLELRNITDTQRTLEQVREALIGFAMANGRLPCPARGQTPAGTTDSTTWAPTSVDAGNEQWDASNSRCFVVSGVVPWATLGVPEADAWGRRFTYRVSHAFADAISLASHQSLATPALSPVNASLMSPANQTPTCAPTPTPTLSSFALCSLGDIAVYNRNESTKARVTIGSALPAVVVSHGRNGYGAFQSNGMRFSGTGDSNGDGVPDQNSDEAANVNGNMTLNPFSSGGYLQWAYYSRPAVAYSGSCSDTTAGSPPCEFDDIVLMISPSTLMARMVSAGRLP
jgi:prepilin-type N-terminal cleavage/methylation domain-containing protein